MIGTYRFILILVQDQKLVMSAVWRAMLAVAIWMQSTILSLIRSVLWFVIRIWSWKTQQATVWHCVWLIQMTGHPCELELCLLAVLQAAAPPVH